MSLGSYILYLRALQGGITPREVATELTMPEHYIHAIELEKHGGDVDSRSKLATYFKVEVDEFTDCSRSTHARFLEMMRKERRPQVGFLLMNGDTLLGTVDGADSSIVKIVEINSGVKTILQRHAIKKWWNLKEKSRDDRRGGPRFERRPSGGAQREGGVGRGRPPGVGSRPPAGRPINDRAGDDRPPMVERERPLGERGERPPSNDRFSRPDYGSDRNFEPRPRPPFGE